MYQKTISKLYMLDFWEIYKYIYNLNYILKHVCYLLIKHIYLF